MTGITIICHVTPELVPSRGSSRSRPRTYFVNGDTDVTSRPRAYSAETTVSLPSGRKRPKRVTRG